MYSVHACMSCYIVMYTLKNLVMVGPDMYMYLHLSSLLSPQSTNSTRYQHLIDKLFSTDARQLAPWTFYLEPPDNKRERPKKVYPQLPL